MESQLCYLPVARVWACRFLSLSLSSPLYQVGTNLGSQGKEFCESVSGLGSMSDIRCGCSMIMTDVCRCEELSWPPSALGTLTLPCTQTGQYGRLLRCSAAGVWPPVCMDPAEAWLEQWTWGTFCGLCVTTQSSGPCLRALFSPDLG